VFRSFRKKNVGNMTSYFDRLKDSLDFIPMQVVEDCWSGAKAPLCSYSPYANIAGEQKRALVAEATADPSCDRAVGCVVGMAVADAVGHPLEFLPAVDGPGVSGHRFNLADLTYTEPLNRFKLEPGQWTDDASMGLCIADSLIATGHYDGSDIRLRFWNWWFKGYNNCFRFQRGRSNSVGLGGNISKSLHIMRPGQLPPPRYEAATEDAGIGSLMRLGPIPVFFHRDASAAMQYGAESSYTTHPGGIAAVACSFLSYVLVRAIENPLVDPADTKAFLDSVAAEFLGMLVGQAGAGIDELRALLESNQPDDGLERCWNWKSDSLDITGTLARRGQSYNGYEVLPGYFGAYCMDGLAIALHSVYHTQSFDEAIAKCVNFLGDADSTGAIAGQLAGAIHGYRSINSRFIDDLLRWDDGDVALRAVLLYELGARSAAR